MFTVMAYSLLHLSCVIVFVHLLFTEGDSHEIIEEVLSNKRVFLTQNLSSDDLVDYLKQERMIDDSIHQKLGMHCFTPMEKNRWIVDSLVTGPPDILKKFCTILRKVKKSYIADELERGMYNSDPGDKEFGE